MTTYYYEDLQACGDNEEKRRCFSRDAIRAQKSTPAYRTAEDAESYYAKHNLTMERYRKVLYTISGKAYPDIFSANYKLTTLFFRRFVLQQAQFVLSNGVSFENPDTSAMLGKTFENTLQKLAKKAVVDGVSFGFWNLDHLEVFSYAETPVDAGFTPIWDTNTGALMAGIRYWHIDKTLRFTLYEVDGYTEYEEKDGVLSTLEEKRSYILRTETTQADGTYIVGGSNYGSLPIIPMYANDLHESEIVGIRSSIDCYDFIKSGLADTIDDTSSVYWTLKNTGGMGDVDLAKFLERMRVVRAAALDDDVDAEAHTLDVPYEAREAMLNRLRSDLYEDFGLLDTEKILSGNLTATAIRMGYQTQEDKCGDFEWHIRAFIAQLFHLIGIEDNPTFTWNRIANQLEETQMVLMAANYLDDEAILNHLPWLTTEEVADILARRDAESLTRFGVTEGAANGAGGANAPIVEKAVEAAEESAGKTLNGAQTQSLIGVIGQLAAGTITEWQAANIISISIGVTKEEAYKIIRGE